MYLLNTLFTRLTELNNMTTTMMIMIVEKKMEIMGILNETVEAY